MGSETKQCQNCKNRFTIEPDDFTFYEKMQVPPPTWCPECRRQRRFVWRNERSLYRRPSDMSGKDIICLYSADKPFKVYEQKEWWGDGWDALTYGRAYNFSKPFFQQFQELEREVPRISISNQKCLNSDYTNQSYSNKNCYLCFSIADSEDCIYSANINECKQLLDDLYVSKSELLYECVDADQCYNSSFLVNSDNCLNSAFLFDCKGCQNCTGGVGLRNKQYILGGEQLTKEEYEKKLKESHLETYEGREMAKAKFADLILKFPRKSQRFKKCVNSTGDLLTNCRNVRWGFSAYDLEDCRYITRIYTCKDTFDSYGLGEAELIYETIGNQTVYNVKFSNVTSDSRNCTYCDLCFNCEDCFGCIGLKKKQYCILNKQYSKEEYEAFIPKIIEHMNAMPYVDAKGRVYQYGEFFPVELSPYAYNETIAEENFPLTKEEAEARKYVWKDPEKREYKVTMKSSALPSSIGEVDDSILDQVIECTHNEKCSEQCTQAFRITPEEFALSRRMNVPPPRLCPNCRHYARLRQRNPLELWHRKCQCAGSTSSPQERTNYVYANTAKHFHGEGKCPNEFETSYPEEGKEIVYCESCYNSEVT